MIVVMRRALLLAVLASCRVASAGLAAERRTARATARPAGIAVDGDGNVYVSDYAQDRVVKFGPDGSVLAQWGGSGSGARPVQRARSAWPSTTATRCSSSISSTIACSASRADGSVLGAWGGAGAGASDLRTPFGVAVGGGRVYVADFGNDRVAGLWLRRHRCSAAWAGAAAATASSCDRRAWPSIATARCT